MAIGSNASNRAAACLVAGLLLSLCGAPAALAAADMELAVRPGDTLIGISRRYLDREDRWREVKRLNRIGDELRLVPGSRLRLPAAWLRWSAATAEVLHVQGTVRGPAGTLAPGMRLLPGDAIDTGAEGILTLRLGDGATVAFPPGSRARLGRAREIKDTPLRDTAIVIEAGGAEGRVPDLRESGSRFELNTPRVVTAVRGTRFRVGADGESSHHEVLAGTVHVSGAKGKPTALQPGQGLLSEAGRLGAVVALPAAPELRGIPDPIERTVLPLEALPRPGVAAWRWQVAADAEFAQVVRDQRTREPAWMMAAPADGDYFLRVSAIDGQGLQGKETVVPIAVRARPEPPLMMGPAPDGRIFGSPVMRWTESEGAVSAHLQVARDAAFSQIVVDRPNLAERHFAASGEWPEGDYHWRLAARRADGHRGPFGEPARFAVLPAPTFAPPDLESDALRLRWSGPGDMRYRLQVAADAGFGPGSVVHEAVVSGTQAELPAPSGGVYFARTQPLLAGEGEEAPWSAPQRFEVPGERPWWLLILLFPLL